MDFDNNQIDAIENLDVFMTLAGESFAPYATADVIDGNLKSLYEWGAQNLPGGLLAFKQCGAYEIALERCIAAGTLQRDPNWISRADRNKQLQQEWDGLSVEQAKERYLVDGEFKRFVDSAQGGF